MTYRILRGCQASQVQAAIISAQRQSAWLAGSAICEYGSLPGMMEPSATAPFSLIWKLFEPNCQIKDELSRILGPAPWTFFHSYMPGTTPYDVWAKDARTKMVSNIGPQV